MKIQDLSGKKVCILGFGKEGQAMFQAIQDHASDAYVTLSDKNPEPIEKLIKANSPSNPMNLKHSLVTRGGADTWLRELGYYDVIIKSPGIPPLPELDAVKEKVTSPTQIFLDSIADSGATVIGVTGSKGKSTTSSLIAAILKEDGRDVHLVGNIGEPSILHIGDAKKDAVFVLEMSSYQLMDLTVSPHVAVVASFFPEHLDYHGSEANYLEAKKHIARFQAEGDAVYFCSDFHGCIEIAKEGKGSKIPFTASDCPVTLTEINLIGEHNLSNIAGAYKVCESFGVNTDAALSAIKAFKGLPHRLQFLGEKHGIVWVDDAISTTPESAIAGLHAIGDKADTMILGGQDRGYDFAELAHEILLSPVRNAILFPDTGARIRAAIETKDTANRIALHDAASMEEAVAIAKKVTKPGSVCLLSTASPSYNMFRNFEDKGEQFQAYVFRS